MIKKMSDYPIAVAGLCLGTVSICGFWSAAVSNKAISDGLSILGFLIATFFLIPLLLRFLFYPQLFAENLREGDFGVVLPNISMTLMLMSHTLGLVNRGAADTLWVLAVATHIVFFSFFVYHRCRDFKLNDLVPSWFVPPVGIVIACLVVPSPFFLPLAHVLLCVGIISYLILQPIMLYRLSIGGVIEDMRKPSLAVLAAPASLTLAGYLTLVTHLNSLVVLFLFSLSMLNIVSVYLLLFALSRLPFTPSCTAFTFPLAITAVAMYKMSGWIAIQPLFQQYTVYVYAFAFVAGVIATLVVLYVLWKIIVLIVGRGLVSR